VDALVHPVEGSALCSLHVWMAAWLGCLGTYWTGGAAVVDDDCLGMLGLDRLVLWTLLMPMGGCGWFLQPVHVQV